MFKSILKEIIITLLLFIAIILVLAVIFYDYNPINKIVPNKIAYSTPQNVKNEVEEQITEIQETNIVYTIDGSDLNVYKRTNSYVSGKSNPFSTTVEQTEETTTNTTNSTKTNSTKTNTTKTNTTKTNTTKTNTTKSNTTGTFFNNASKK